MMDSPISPRKIKVSLKDEEYNFNIPDAVIDKWQRTVDLLAKAMGSNCGRVARLLPDYFETLVTCDHELNTDKVGDQFSLTNDTLKWYCKHVCDTRELLSVNDSAKDEEVLGYASTDREDYGVKSYMGYPIELPDGNLFGTICVEDLITKQYTSVEEEILASYKQIVEEDIRELYDQYKELRRVEDKAKDIQALNNALVLRLKETQEESHVRLQVNEELRSKIEEQNKEVEKLSNILNTCADVNAHELRGPVARILGLVKVINASDQHIDEALTHLNKAALELDNIIHEIQNTIYKA